MLNNNLLTVKEAAKYLGLTNHNTLYVWQCNKRYKLPFVKIGSKVMYRKTDLDEFIQSNLQNTESEDE